jgi:glycosyltransferase involved in cell wall biosynthesis
MYEIFPFLGKFAGTPGDYDIIHSNSWNGYAFRTTIPLVVTEHHVVHDPAFDLYKTPAQKIYHRWIFRYEKKSLDSAESVTCDCEYTKKKLEEVFGYTDARVVYAGVDHTLFRPLAAKKPCINIPDGRTVLFFAGNLSKRKGADLLPRIMKQLGNRYVLLVASGQKPGSILGCENIISLGRLETEDLVDVYNLCDIFLTASRLEGFGLSVAEAMSCAKPVVATNGSSFPELVVDGKGGLLCKMDNISDFAEKISMLASDKDLQRKMGLFNRKRVEEMFTIEQMTKGYISVYQSVLR